MLTLKFTQQSYCAICHEPGQIGFIEVTGWQHKVPCCAGCLRKMAVAIERGDAPSGETR